MEDVTGNGDLELILQLSDGNVRCYSLLYLLVVSLWSV